MLVYHIDRITMPHEDDVKYEVVQQTQPLSPLLNKKKDKEKDNKDPSPEREPETEEKKTGPRSPQLVITQPLITQD